MSTQKIKQNTAIAGLVFATFAWGASFVLVKTALAEMNLYYFLFLRFSLASILMAVIFWKQVSGAGRSTVGAAFLLGALLAAAYIAQTEGLKITSSANAALITCLFMVLIPFFSYFYNGSRVGIFPVVGIALSFAGMYLLTCMGLTGINRGDAIVLGCAVAVAWHVIMTGKYARSHRLIPLVTYQFIFVALISGVAAALKGGVTLNISSRSLFTILFTGVFATIVAFLIQTAAQRVLSPARTGVICALEAVFGALIPWALLIERPRAISVAGALLMVAGMVVSELKSAAFKDGAPVRAEA